MLHTTANAEDANLSCIAHKNSRNLRNIHAHISTVRQDRDIHIYIYIYISEAYNGMMVKDITFQCAPGIPEAVKILAATAESFTWP